MGLRASFSVTGDLGYPAIVGLTPVDYSEGCEVFVERFIASSKQDVPVDTGALRSSLDSDTDGDQITCVADKEYAQYVEYGTSRMREQPYFEPALIATYQAAAPIWRGAQADAQEEEEERQATEQQENSGMGNAIGHAAEFGVAKSFGFSFGGMILGAIIGGIIAGFLNVLEDIMTGGHSSSSFHMSGSEMESQFGGTLERMNIEIT